jgi:hypothetical protein
VEESDLDKETLEARRFKVSFGLIPRADLKRNGSDPMDSHPVSAEWLFPTVRTAVL